eukprot:Mycagemm_TRINITY_DN10321_c5_g13::TRINITY_DN10321_c5_g13_i1::g.779::m.779 type:complete len:124 gc:universal TRINITY_DN10321_c5_g13_i1:539-168(-)
MYSSSKQDTTSVLAPLFLISGRYGGRLSRLYSLSQRTDLKNGCCLISAAPLGPLPRRFLGSRLSSALMIECASAVRYAGSLILSLSIFSWSFGWLLCWKGGFPVSMSYTRIPRLQKSAERPYP